MAARSHPPRRAPPRARRRRRSRRRCGSSRSRRWPSSASLHWAALLEHPRDRLGAPDARARRWPGARCCCASAPGAPRRSAPRRRGVALCCSSPRCSTARGAAALPASPPTGTTSSAASARASARTPAVARALPRRRPVGRGSRITGRRHGARWRSRCCWPRGRGAGAIGRPLGAAVALGAALRRPGRRERRPASPLLGGAVFSVLLAGYLLRRAPAHRRSSAWPRLCSRCRRSSGAARAPAARRRPSRGWTTRRSPRSSSRPRPSVLLEPQLRPAATGRATGARCCGSSRGPPALLEGGQPRALRRHALERTASCPATTAPSSTSTAAGCRPSASSTAACAAPSS